MAYTLRVGIAGLGNEGHQILPHVGEASGVGLTAVADVRAEALHALKDQQPEVETFSSVAGVPSANSSSAV